ncbi:TIGR04222 domain-containing membrane protein [Streptomyces coeruleorubidus]|uniref:TIGR04222 domain-containing membrane protein n=1 Tax=Streptomyces coeruleorubidus TaxID=116188 RepID=UPI00237F777F|nr:TIGR04222 domain-containing membrane protein [Streptomyces coeruleorubidus]WDV52233.1 TIGR04222 domain-containing membrane protein [Streptomyces coeruleorubidus]
MLDEGLYVAALILTTGAIGYRLAVAARIARMLKAEVTVREDLSAEELAFLAGGPRRVVATVLFRMTGQGRLSVAEDGTVIFHDDLYAADATAGIEKALIKAAGISRSERVGKLVAHAAANRGVQAIGDRLQAEGLLIAPSLRRRQHRARRLLWWLAALPPVLTVYEITAGTPDRWWAGVALSAIATLTATLIKPAKAWVPYRVQSTLDLLRAERERPASWRPAGALTALAVTPVGAVALDGLAASQEPELRALVTPETWRAGDPAHGGASATGCGTYGDWGSSGHAGACGGGGAGGCGSAGS